MRTYCIKRCLSIRHGTGLDRASAHSHTIEVAAYLKKEGPEILLFSGVEQLLDSFLSRYENRFLNSLPAFDGDASMERIGEVIFTGLTPLLEERGLFLERLEVGETPLRRYIIGRLDRPKQALGRRDL